MKDEIKEILDKLKSDDYYEKEYQKSVYYERDLKKLEDYTTNLEEKYNNSQITLAEEWKKRLEIEEKNKHLDNQITMLKQQNNAITEIGLDYKSRNEKAIEYIKNTGCYEEDTKIFCTDIYGDELVHLLNILTGGDEE